MAAALFHTWERLGRPLEPAQPVREIVDRLKVAFPRAAALFGWHADEAHYTADPPQDHTPFSADGWPAPDPQWWVCATDVMHRPDLGVDCRSLFGYWLSEARAGRMPWLKYLIWQATIYDVRHGWRPQPSAGHFDHIHLSTRTDHLTTHLGAWPLVPEEDDMDVKDLFSANTRSGAHPVLFLPAFNKLTEDAAAAAAGVTALRAVVEQLAAVITAGGGTVDTAAILAGVDNRLASLREQIHADVDTELDEQSRAGADND